MLRDFWALETGILRETVTATTVIAYFPYQLGHLVRTP